VFAGMIFDLDGVIADTHPIHRQAWRQLLRERGLQVSEKELDVILGGHRREEILRHFLGRLSDVEIFDYGERKDQLFHQWAAELRAIPGVLDLLQELESAGVPMALATSAGKRRALQVLERLGLTDRFRAVVTAEDVAKCKPDPSIFHLAASRLHVMPRQLVVAEDSEVGVRAAKSAGMKCLGIGSGARVSRLCQEGADSVVPDFRWVSLANLQSLFHAPQPAVKFSNWPAARVSHGIPGEPAFESSKSSPERFEFIGRHEEDELI
jgi:beta-phosphoglucomutase family hydrolase